jgi:hypothetical protein
LCQKLTNRYEIFLDPLMTRLVTDTFRTIQLSVAIFTGLVMSGAATPAWSQPAFLSRPVQATFQRIPLVRLVSQLSILSGGIIVLDRQIDPTQYITIACEGESLHTVLWRLADKTETEIAILESSVWITPFGKASQLEQADRERQRTLRLLPVTAQKQLRTKRPLQWLAGQQPATLIMDLLSQPITSGQPATTGLTITTDGLPEEIPHDHLAAQTTPPLTLPEQLDLIAMQYDQQLLWSQSSESQSTLVVTPASLPPSSGTKKRETKQKPTLTRPPKTEGSNRERYTLRVAAPFEELFQAISQRLNLEPSIDTEAFKAHSINAQEIIRLEIKDANRDQLLDAIVKPLGLTWSIDDKTLHVTAGD